MQELRISDALTIGPQPTEVRMEELFHEGVKTVVNLSRKGEEGVVFLPHEEGQIAEKFELNYVHFPVSISALKHATVDEFVEDIGKVEHHIYMHCRIGQRSGLFGMIFHALRRGLAPQAALQKGKSWSLWNAPYLSDFALNYLEKKSGVYAPADDSWGRQAAA